MMLTLGKVVGGVRGCETQSSSVSGSSMVSGHSFTHLTSFFPLNQQSKIPSDNKCAVLLSLLLKEIKSLQCSHLKVDYQGQVFLLRGRTVSTGVGQYLQRGQMGQKTLKHQDFSDTTLGRTGPRVKSKTPGVCSRWLQLSPELCLRKQAEGSAFRSFAGRDGGQVVGVGVCSSAPFPHPKI